MSPESKEHFYAPVIVLVGPTAIGKTSLSLDIAETFDAEIISMDSMQVYRYMNIGTAKASDDERKRVPHYLIDIRDPDQQYDAALFVQDALAAIKDIISRNKIPLITGGTGMYLNSLVNGLFEEIKVDSRTRKSVHSFFQEEGREAAYKRLVEIDPDTARRVHLNDTQRLLRGLEIFAATGKSWSKHIAEQKKQQKKIIFHNLLGIGLHCERSILYERIETRADLMMKNGFPEEVESLFDMGYTEKLPSMQSIGYKQVAQYILGTVSYEQTVSEMIRDTRRYAKRQFTWFRKNDFLHWFLKSEQKEIFASIQSLLKKADWF